MPKPPSITDVAAMAGVSVGTVSNVLNRPGLVATPTRTRVQRAIKTLGFIRNESARHLGSGQSRAIGLVVLDVGNPFFTDIARGAQESARSRNAAILIADSAEDEAAELANVELFAQQRVQGVLIAPTGAPTDWIGVLERAGIPFVVIDRADTGATRSHCAVSVDDRAGGLLAASHLLEMGHRRIAFVGGPSTLSQVRDRRAGAEQAVAAVPGSTLLAVSTGGLNVEAGRAAAEYLTALPDAERPTAAFAANDLVALGLLQGCVAHHLRAPEDLALIGYDDIYVAAAAAVPLSSIRQPRVDLGRKATDLLLEEIADSRTLDAAGSGHEHRLLQFQPELVVRASTAGH